MYVKPNPDKLTKDGEPIKVFDPIKKKWLPAVGANVPSNPYWVRRLAAGEVIKATAEDVDTCTDSGTDDNAAGGEPANTDATPVAGEPTPEENQDPAIEEPAVGANMPEAGSETTEQEEKSEPAEAKTRKKGGK